MSTETHCVLWYLFARVMHKITSCGVLVVRDASLGAIDGLEALLLRHALRWDLPKGHLEQGEDEQTCAFRELREETGLTHPDIELVSGFRREHIYHPRYKRFGGERVEKTLVLFLARLRNDRPIRTTEHDTHRWVSLRTPPQDAPDSIREAFAAAVRVLS